MHREGESAGLIDGISYGFNLETLFFRFDYRKAVAPYNEKWNITINFLYPKPQRITVNICGKESKGTILEKSPETGQWKECGELRLLASGGVVEAGISFKELSAKGWDEVRLFIDIEAEAGLERWPPRGFLVIEVPTEDFESRHWAV